MEKYGDELNEFYNYQKPLMVERMVYTLIGIIDGIEIDKKINDKELKYLRNWLNEHGGALGNPMLRELMQSVEEAISDSLLTSSERDGIKYLAEKIVFGGSRYKPNTNDIQLLHGVLGGISSDGVVTDDELRGLNNWINDNYHLKGSFPFDEIESIVHHYLIDNKFTVDEYNALLNYFSQFQKVIDGHSITNRELHIDGICSINVDIILPGSLFCFTGISAKGKRREIAAKIIDRGGKYNDVITNDTDYLIVGSNGNPCWAFACYGRKVEKAVEMRKMSYRISIVNENDLWDALA